MERPVSLHPDDIRDEKTKVIRSMRIVAPEDVVLGQYSATDDKPSYLDDPGVPADSQTPTFAAVRIWIDNDRWEVRFLPSLCLPFCPLSEYLDCKVMSALMNTHAVHNAWCLRHSRSLRLKSKTGNIQCNDDFLWWLCPPVCVRSTISIVECGDGATNTASTDIGCRVMRWRYPHHFCSYTSTVATFRILIRIVLIPISRLLCHNEKPTVKMAIVT